MIERLLKVIPHNELYSSSIKGLFLRHSDQPFCYEGIIQEPSICIVLSGEREVQLGEQCYRFDNQHFMFCPVNIPMRGEIKYAEPQKPFLVMSMKIDIESVSKILLANPNLADDVQQGDEGFAQWHLDESLKMLLNAYYSCTKIQKILGFLHRLSNKKFIIDSLQASKVANLKPW